MLSNPARAGFFGEVGEMGEKAEIPALHPDEIVRWSKGPRFFGYGLTALAEKIKKREIPPPFPLSDTGSAKGWTGRQIIEHHRRRQAAAAAAKEMEGGDDGTS